MFNWSSNYSMYSRRILFTYTSDVYYSATSLRWDIFASNNVEWLAHWKHWPVTCNVLRIIITREIPVYNVFPSHICAPLPVLFSASRSKSIDCACTRLHVYVCTYAYVLIRIHPWYECVENWTWDRVHISKFNFEWYTSIYVHFIYIYIFYRKTQEDHELRII